MKKAQKSSAQSMAMKMLIDFHKNIAGSKTAALEQNRDSRFTKVAAILLTFMSEKQATLWFNRPCRCETCDALEGKPPRWDLLNSAYGFDHLMKELAWQKALALPFYKGDRVKRLETGQKGIVDKQFMDGEVSVVFDGGQPAVLQATSLEKIEDGSA
ncbi:MAG: hypothetical protein KGI60_03430 [Patescibacteria group bacterium]|nr:hypothetical protein [Patescibacteria group bacterium]